MKMKIKYFIYKAELTKGNFKTSVLSTAGKFVNSDYIKQGGEKVRQYNTKERAQETVSLLNAKLEMPYVVGILNSK
jgi:hypothetical protein